MKIEIDTSEAVEEVKKLREETDLLIQSLEKAIELVDQIGSKKYQSIDVDRFANHLKKAIEREFQGKNRITYLPSAASITTNVKKEVRSVKDTIDKTIETICKVVQEEIDAGGRNTSMISALAELVKARAELEEKLPAILQSLF